MTTASLRRIQVRVPHRISGFFQVVESEAGRPIEDLARVGSRGGGPALTAFGITTVEVEDLPNTGNNEQNIVSITINGQDSTETAQTTKYVVTQLLPRLTRPIKVKISHDFDLPIGCGYGASGAGALGCAIGLCILLDLNLTQNQAGKIAHIAEVMNKTGLGTVGGQFVGGFSLTTEAGFPFTMEKLLFPPDLHIVCGTFGKILTSGILKEWKYKEKISRYGAEALKGVLQKPNVRTFMSVSREFVEKVGLIEALELENVRTLLNDLDRLPILGASMNQLGQSVFVCCTSPELKQVIEVFESYKPSIDIFNLGIHPCGPEILNPED